VNEQYFPLITNQHHQQPNFSETNRKLGGATRELARVGRDEVGAAGIPLVVAMKLESLFL
jgi:hypothetical protein